METTTERVKSTQKPAEVKRLAEHPRKGVFADDRAGQYACRVGYQFNDRAERVRAFQRLTGDADEATVRHIGLLPITLNFARRVGEILREVGDWDPLTNFKYYM